MDIFWLTTTKTSVQQHCHEGIIIMASLQWSHHDGFITMMTSSQQQNHLYNGVIVKVL